jgi:peptide/nickel transport system permease protein
MSAYIIRRIFFSLLIIVIVTILVFLGMRLLPGDPVLLIISRSESRQITEEEIALLRHEYGLDKPMVVQYFDWMGGVLRGDLGKSIHTNRPVFNELARRIPITLHLTVLAFILSICIGVPAGVICAIRRGRWVDTIVTTLANAGITIPVFWLGIVLMYVFALQLNWLPIFGYTSPFKDFWLNTRQIIMPVFCLAVYPLASLARQTRSSMLEVMHQDYIRTAWSKGLRERLVILRHALKNSLIPVVTLIGTQTPQLVGGSVFVETVFNIPGMGRLAVTSMFDQDYPVTQGVILIIAIAVVLSNLVVDLSYGWIDPRIRYR